MTYQIKNQPETATEINVEIPQGGGFFEFRDISQHYADFGGDWTYNEELDVYEGDSDAMEFWTKLADLESRKLQLEFDYLEDLEMNDPKGYDYYQNYSCDLMDQTLAQINFLEEKFESENA